MEEDLKRKMDLRESTDDVNKDGVRGRGGREDGGVEGMIAE